MVHASSYVLLWSGHTSTACALSYEKSHDMILIGAPEFRTAVSASRKCCSMYTRPSSSLESGIWVYTRLERIWLASYPGSQWEGLYSWMDCAGACHFWPIILHVDKNRPVYSSQRKTVIRYPLVYILLYTYCKWFLAWQERSIAGIRRIVLWSLF